MTCDNSAKGVSRRRFLADVAAAAAAVTLGAGWLPRMPLRIGGRKGSWWSVRVWPDWRQRGI